MPKDILKVVIIGDGGVGKVEYLLLMHNACSIYLTNAMIDRHPL
jgi:hypothetical protein